MSKMHRSEAQQINMLMGTMTAMIKPMIAQKYGVPESEAVKEQIDVLVTTISKMFPGLSVLVSLDDIKGLMYNMKQKDLDEFYSTVELALEKRV